MAMTVEHQKPLVDHVSMPRSGTTWYASSPHAHWKVWTAVESGSLQLRGCICQCCVGVACVRIVEYNNNITLRESNNKNAGRCAREIRLYDAH